MRLTVDSRALVANWNTLNRLSGAAEAGAAVKANAYGLGIGKTVPALWEAGCRDFFVAHWSEAGPVAAHVPAASVSVLHGPLTEQDAIYARHLGVKPVINSLAQARRWIDAGGGQCDVMVDTGINRIGLPLTDLGDSLILQLSIDILHSHLASADEVSHLNALQLERWNDARGQVAHRRASLANSAGITLGSAYHGDLTRPGIAIYGGTPCAALDGKIAQVARLEAAIIQVRELKSGDSVGYNATYVASRQMRVGVVSLGYADGYFRVWSNAGTMIHQGQALPVIGRVSMDMTVIDLSNAPTLAEGDWVEVVYDLPDAAAKTGLSQYELLTGLGRRFAS